MTGSIITASDKAANDYFGNAVDITNDYAFVGAYVDDVTFTNQGSVYVFTNSGDTLLIYL